MEAWLVANIPRAILNQLAQVVGPSQLNLGGISIAKSRPERLAKGIVNWYVSRQRLHELFEAYGAPPSEWKPYAGRNENVETITAHLCDHLSGGEILVLFQDVLHREVSGQIVVKRSFTQQLVQAIVADGMQERLYQIMCLSEHPLSGLQ